MKHHCQNWYLCALLALLVAAVGCNRSAPPPTALTEAELPSALETAFSKAKPDIKDLATQVVAAVQAKEYAKAFQSMQALSAKTGLTKEQINVISRATLTVNDLLQAAQAQGDKKAAQTIKRYQTDK